MRAQGPQEYCLCTALGPFLCLRWVLMGGMVQAPQGRPGRDNWLVTTELMTLLLHHGASSWGTPLRTSVGTILGMPLSAVYCYATSHLKTQWHDTACHLIQGAWGSGSQSTCGRDEGAPHPSWSLLSVWGSSWDVVKTVLGRLWGNRHHHGWEWRAVQQYPSKRRVPYP